MVHTLPLKTQDKEVSEFQVGIFDSGVGGLTVARAISKALPHIPLIYFADSIHLPYGNKSRENILSYSVHNANFLKSKGATLLVAACNTSSAIALPTLYSVFPNVSIIGVIDPGARAAVALTQKKKIGVIGTFRTINSNAYKKKLLSLDDELTVYEKACPLLVPVIEEGLKNEQILQAILHEYLDEFIAEVDVLILGCTHYPLIKRQIKKMFPHLAVVDSATAISEEVKGLFENFNDNRSARILPKSANSATLETETRYDDPNSEINRPNVTLYTNDLNETFITLAKKIFKNPNIVLV